MILVTTWSPGAPGLLLTGSTGEQHCLCLEERCDLRQQARSATGHDVTLYAGVAAMKTKHAVTLALGAAAANMDAIILGFTPSSGSRRMMRRRM